MGYCKKKYKSNLISAASYNLFLAAKFDLISAASHLQRLGGKDHTGVLPSGQFSLKFVGILNLKFSLKFVDILNFKDQP